MGSCWLIHGLRVSGHSIMMAAEYALQEKGSGVTELVPVTRASTGKLNHMSMVAMVTFM
jgi:hypothetical protein